MLATVPLAMAGPDPQAARDVIAVNVLLLPDPQLVASAQEINHALRQAYPAGFALDASHVPHISVLHAYVRSKDLVELCAAVRTVSQKHPLIGRQLAVNGTEHKPWKDDAEITNIKVEKVPELESFQSDLLTALSRYFVESGDQHAFVTSQEDPEVDQETIDYVRTFAQKHVGTQFTPHVTVGISDAETARQVTAQHVPPAKLTIAAVAVFQLGNVGTARKELWRYSP
jgi:hypothetical protein